MSDYLIEVERDSVCMGDDVDAPHYYSFKVSVHSTLNDLFEHLAKKPYLAYVGGKNHSWEAIIDNMYIATIQGNNQKPEPSISLTDEVSKFVNSGSLNVRFKYNSSAT